ncbi:MAG: hypothetical protein JJE52_00135 [Acidimicrobiia bacterium]|nr:hypothetical protein [Acidimicrobiia bacterium]
MVLAVLKGDDVAYQLVYLLHIATFVVAFAGAITNPRLGGLAAASDDATRGRIGQLVADGTAKVHFPALALTGLFGIALIVMSDDIYQMSQTWISIAFALWLAMLAVIWFALLPAQRRTASGDIDAKKKVGMFTGIIHLLFVLMLVDMVFKPGL